MSVTPASDRLREARELCEGLGTAARGALTPPATEDVLEAYRLLSSELANAASDAERSEREASELLASQRCARSLIDDVLVRRLQTVERVQAAIQQLDDLGPVSALIDAAPKAAAAAADLDRLLLSRIDDESLVVESLYSRNDPARAVRDLSRLQHSCVRIAYPLIEAEMMRRRKAVLATEMDVDAHARQAHHDIMRWHSYVASPVVLGGRVIGFLVGDRPAGPNRLDAIDRDALELFATRFSQTFERAALRRRVRIQQREMRQIASWADSLTSEMSDRAINLVSDRDYTRGGEDRVSQNNANVLDGVLTRREIEVLKLMVTGETNAGIARALVVSEGTIKFHVKNVLRKMQAANRADATSRYLHLTLGHTPSDEALIVRESDGQ
jgi:DNA-binding CsgD family transcriptional regulator